MLVALAGMILVIRNALVLVGLLIAVPGLGGMAGGFDGMPPLSLMSRRRRFTIVAIGLAIATIGLIARSN